MSRVKLTEYKAKQLLLGDTYAGVSLPRDIEKLIEKPWVVKVDQGIKKRMKQGLVKVNVSKAEIPGILNEWQGKGFSNFIAEPLLTHEQSSEQYLSLERVRNGIRVLHAASGGIDIEELPSAVTNITVVNSDDVAEVSKKTKLPEAFLQNLFESFEKNFFAFVEINPLVVEGDEIFLLDAAVLVDSAGMFFARGAWNEDDIVEGRKSHVVEENVAALQKTTPASLKLTVLNPNGSLFFLLSGGGGSIVAADEAALLGAGHQIVNYGEYSGGPTREETYLYTKEVLNLLSASTASKKAIIIAGGVANFTDVQSTFAGIIDALTEVCDLLRTAYVKVFVRRGGPNEKKGLSHMETFLEKEGLLGSVYGSDIEITKAIDDAVAYIGTP